MMPWEKERWDEIADCNEDKISECERILEIIKRETNVIIGSIDDWIKRAEFRKERGIE